LEDGDWTVRNRAVLELAEVEDDPRALTAILEALRDPQHQVRLNAAWALEDRGD
jgi:HEAT repeat protein